ncbi:hypothetical protein Gotur_020351 [Gossypium turneri]
MLIKEEGVNEEWRFTGFKRIPSFKFEVWWTAEESIEEEIKKSWESSSGFVFKKIERLQWEFIKINFDGAYNKNQNWSASGVVARDSEGKILLSCSEIHNEISSAFAAEAIACWKAVQVEVEKGWQSLIFEGDSLAIIKKCSTKGQDRSMVGAYIYDIQQKIQGLNDIRFLHTSRSANNLAHILATETLKRGEEIYLEMGVPEYAEDQARHDGMSKPD